EIEEPVASADVEETLLPELVLLLEFAAERLVHGLALAGPRHLLEQRPEVRLPIEPVAVHRIAMRGDLTVPAPVPKGRLRDTQEFGGLADAQIVSELGHSSSPRTYFGAVLAVKAYKRSGRALPVADLARPLGM